MYSTSIGQIHVRELFVDGNAVFHRSCDKSCGLNLSDVVANDVLLG